MENMYIQALSDVTIMSGKLRRQTDGEYVYTSP